ncbi:MAG: hypothetical protein H6Q80_1246 [Deltaproteobacteria bacterium]|jgi:hypothetical protein|nr:hypothetical protein [Deltaproteobacteria bacterium]
MAPKRGNTSRGKSDDLRFVVTRPKPSGRIKLPDRLFHPERRSPARGARPKVEPKALPLESYLPNLSLPARTLAILIAAISICGSLVTLVLGVRDGKWLLVLLAPFGVWYGIAWVRVAQEGWLPGGRLRLNPWGRG